VILLAPAVLRDAGPVAHEECVSTTTPAPIEKFPGDETLLQAAESKGAAAPCGPGDLAISEPARGNAARRRDFEALALPLGPSLRATARHLVRDSSAADDLVQEAFLRAYRSFDRFEPGTNIRAWLFTILFSVVVNAYRKARIEQDTVSIAELEARFDRGLELADPTAHLAIVENVSRVHDAVRVNQALAALPEPFRSAVVLVDIQEFPYEEAAAVIGCPIGTLRSRLFRGRRAIAALLATVYEDPNTSGSGGTDGA
jgi:RNA polymerase sigma-70 factor (ECF subfamily)